MESSAFPWPNCTPLLIPTPIVWWCGAALRSGNHSWEEMTHTFSTSSHIFNIGTKKPTLSQSVAENRISMVGNSLYTRSDFKMTESHTARPKGNQEVYSIGQNLMGFFTSLPFLTHQTLTKIHLSWRGGPEKKLQEVWDLLQEAWRKKIFF